MYSIDTRAYYFTHVGQVKYKDRVTAALPETRMMVDACSINIYRDRVRALRSLHWLCSTAPLVC